MYFKKFSEQRGEFFEEPNNFPTRVQSKKIQGKDCFKDMQYHYKFCTRKKVSGLSHKETGRVFRRKF